MCILYMGEFHGIKLYFNKHVIKNNKYTQRNKKLIKARAQDWEYKQQTGKPVKRNNKAKNW